MREEKIRKSGEREASQDKWTIEIRPASGWFDIHLDELWRYRDLVFLFVRRDFVAIYKQTILGPLWYLLQPIMTTAVFTIIFSRIARLSTDGLPPVLFYLSGVVVWRYFADCLQKTATTFVGNAHLFGKIYFPRLIVPVSVVVSNLISFAIQMILLICAWLYFQKQGAEIRVGAAAFLLPLLIVQMAALGLGCGLIVSSLTTKYRDLAQLVGFGVQLWMFATPIVYPASIVPEEWRWSLLVNPMSPIVETFRYMAFGVGQLDFPALFISGFTTVMILLLGVALFTRIEKSFMDTV